MSWPWSEMLKSLVGQLNDQVGQSNVILTQIAAALEAQGSEEQVSGQVVIEEIYKLARKIDETGTRISALATQVSEMKMQSEALQRRRFQSMSGNPAEMALNADTIFHEAYSDLVQGNLDLAVQGFQSYVRNFPENEKADDAQYYIGAAYYNETRWAEAIAAFTSVLNDYPKGDKLASATYKRAKAELGQGEKTNAIEDFKAVINKFPDSTEASLARRELEDLGVKGIRTRG
jgi:tol-pal system protein YbgF